MPVANGKAHSVLLCQQAMADAEKIGFFNIADTTNKHIQFLVNIEAYRLERTKGAAWLRHFKPIPYIPYNTELSLFHLIAP
ncbi:hypothetical protein [Pseudomonas sp. BS3782 TE3695]|uniref:hypothetical protein n=1 Tax=Pseudomonas sp. BS3782 TE3695 TaxID=3349323 RepID=UPI003D2536EB